LNILSHLVKCKSKLQWNTISPQSEWLSSKNKCWQEWRGLIHCWMWMEISVAPMKVCMEIPQNTKSIATIWPCYNTSEQTRGTQAPLREECRPLSPTHNSDFSSALETIRHLTWERHKGMSHAHWKWHPSVWGLLPHQCLVPRMQSTTLLTVSSVVQTSSAGHEASQLRDFQ
jgi:hypothetical protein